MDNTISKRAENLKRHFLKSRSFQSSLDITSSYNKSVSEMDDVISHDDKEDSKKSHSVIDSFSIIRTSDKNSNHVTFNKYGPVPEIENFAIHSRNYIVGMEPDNRFQNYVRFEDNAMFPIEDCILIDDRYYLRKCNPMKYMFDVSKLPESYFSEL